MRSRIGFCVVLLLLCAVAVAGQQNPAPGEPLEIRTFGLPKAILRQPFRFQLQAQGGIGPLKWRAEAGTLPPGMVLSEDGVLAGTPTQAGDFQIRVTVTDSGKPAYERSQELTLHVVAPLVVEWSRYPRISGQRIEGAIKVTNQTDSDFDLTFIALAVNEAGRATAVGYKHWTLTRETVELEVPFEENLPYGAYDLNVDVVAEVPETNTIHRVHLATKEKLQVRQGP
ncbi:MAG TPA: Ig domain-containing protein [Terriglobales bacterium]|nr:Ig domain-containing protein [Terriglobales bacterium]